MFYVSAGVYSTEKDLSQVVQAISASTAALVGYSGRGNPDEILTITSNQQFLAEYGKPDLTSGSFFHHTALAYLEKGKTLRCLRVHNGALYGGVAVAYGAGTTAAFGTGRATKAVTAPSGSNVLFDVFAKDPGAWNNGLAVAVRYTTTGFQPDSTQYNFWIDVYTVDPVTAVQTLAESFYVSRATKLDGRGQQMYLETVINGRSQYIAVYDNVSIPSTTMPLAGSSVVMTGGTDGSAITDAEIITGWNQFLNPDVVDFRIAVQGGAGTDTTSYAAIQTAMKSVVEARKDAIAVFDVPYAVAASATCPADMVTFRQTQNINSSYTALYGPWVRVYDQYSGQTVLLPPSGYVAAQFAYNDAVAEVWDAPAGINRGQLNVLGVNRIFTQGERDTLYVTPININPLQTFMGQGTVIWGQKTQQASASALDRVATRRTLIVVEKGISASLFGFTFENNNLVIRTRISSMIRAYLDTLNAGGAFTIVDGKPGYSVQCDEKNNTPAIIDQHIIAVNVFVKPAQAGEFIQLQTIITNSGVSFEELIAQGV